MRVQFAALNGGIERIARPIEDRRRPIEVATNDCENAECVAAGGSLPRHDPDLRPATGLARRQQAFRLEQAHICRDEFDVTAMVAQAGHAVGRPGYVRSRRRYGRGRNPFHPPQGIIDDRHSVMRMWFGNLSALVVSVVPRRSGAPGDAAHFSLRVSLDGGRRAENGGERRLAHLAELMSIDGNGALAAADVVRLRDAQAIDGQSRDGRIFPVVTHQ